MSEDQPKCFTEEELKKLSELAKSCMKHTLTEDDFKEIKERMAREED